MRFIRDCFNCLLTLLLIGLLLLALTLFVGLPALLNYLQQITG